MLLEDFYICLGCVVRGLYRFLAEYRLVKRMLMAGDCGFVNVWNGNSLFYFGLLKFVWD